MIGVEDRLHRWALWVQRQSLNGLGYPKDSCIARMEFYGGKGNPVTYEQESYEKPDASATDAVIQKLPDEDRCILWLHYVWHRWTGKRLTVKEKTRILNMSRARYYRKLRAAQSRVEWLLDS